MGPEQINFDFSSVWTWFLLSMRLTGLFTSLPGIGTNQIPVTFRTPAALLIALALCLAGPRVPVPASMIVAALMIGGEFLIGYLFGEVSSLVVSAVAVCGNVSSNAIGLGQANMIDPSLGESVSVMARFQTLLATVIFLAIDGHHTVLRIASGIGTDLKLGQFMPTMAIASLLVDQLGSVFRLGLTLAAPVLITLLITQFVLGLLTKFVPQVNIFIISLPLTVGLGLYIIGFTFPGLTKHVIEEFKRSYDHLGYLLME